MQPTIRTQPTTQPAALGCNTQGKASTVKTLTQHAASHSGHSTNAAAHNSFPKHQPTKGRRRPNHKQLGLLPSSSSRSLPYGIMPLAPLLAPLQAQLHTAAAQPSKHHTYTTHGRQQGGHEKGSQAQLPGGSHDTPTASHQAGWLQHNSCQAPPCILDASTQTPPRQPPACLHPGLLTVPPPGPPPSAAARPCPSLAAQR